MERDCVLQTLKLFRERIGQSGKPTHRQTHRQILTLNVVCGDVIVIGFGRWGFARRYSQLRRLASKIHVTVENDCENDMRASKIRARTGPVPVHKIRFDSDNKR